MGDPPRLALVVHFHQPVDNLERVVARAVRRCYRPFLETIARHPEVPFTLHYSGCLLRWLDRLAPELVELLRQRVAAGQVELLGGGLEEPILAAIPEVDRRSQIERMSALLEGRFGQRPRGLWLTERVWEPPLAASLGAAGIDYTVVDDTSLLAVGVDPGELAGPFVTDHEGTTLRLLGASRELRYRIPYARPSALVRRLEAAGPGRLQVYADDGEKFGEWPGTARQVYGRHWLDRFLDRLGESARGGRLRLLRLAQAVGGPPTPVQLPSSSYDEMMTWALPTAARHRLELASARLAGSDPAHVAAFVRGAPWRGFLAKYPEVQRLEQQMLRVSSRVAGPGTPAEAAAELHLGQCNCGYWHGTFGGAYLPFIRLGLWHHLIRADRLARAAGGAPESGGAEVGDFDADGQAEIRLAGPWGYATIDPAAGGQVVELVSWEGESNLVAVMGRHLESYHLRGAEPSRGKTGMELAPLTAPSVSSSGLEFDAGEVGALRDGVGGEWWDQPYSHSIEGGALWLTAERDGLRLRKRITATAEGLRADYRVEGHGDGPLRVEVRSCPFAPGRKVDRVGVTGGPARARVRLAGALAELGIRAPAASSMSWSRLVALGATLNGVEELVQGASVVLSTEFPPAGGLEITLELTPEPRIRTRGE